MIRHYRSFTTRDYNAVKIISLYRISGRGIFPQNAFFFLQNLQYNLRCFCFVCFSLSENYLNSWNCNRVASTERALWWHHVTRPKPVENLHWFWKTCKLLRILWCLQNPGGVWCAAIAHTVLLLVLWHCLFIHGLYYHHLECKMSTALLILLLLLCSVADFLLLFNKHLQIKEWTFPMETHRQNFGEFKRTNQQLHFS